MFEMFKDQTRTIEKLEDQIDDLQRSLKCYLHEVNVLEAIVYKKTIKELNPSCDYGRNVVISLIKKLLYRNKILNVGKHTVEIYVSKEYETQYIYNMFIIKLKGLQTDFVDESMLCQFLLWTYPDYYFNGEFIEMKDNEK